MKAFGDIKKAEMLFERQQLEDAKREQRGDKMIEKMEVIVFGFNQICSWVSYVFFPLTKIHWHFISILRKYSNLT